MKFWCIKDSQKDINGGIVIFAPDKETALEVYYNEFKYNRVIIQEIKIR